MATAADVSVAIESAAITSGFSKVFMALSFGLWWSQCRFAPRAGLVTPRQTFVRCRQPLEKKGPGRMPGLEVRTLDLEVRPGPALDGSLVSPNARGATRKNPGAALASWFPGL